MGNASNNSLEYTQTGKLATRITEQFFVSLARISKRYIFWVKIVVVIGCILSSIVFGFLTTKVNPLYVPVISLFPVILLLAQVALRRFDLAPLAILLSALFIEFSLPTGTGSRLVISLLVSVAYLGLWVLHSVTVEKRFVIKKSPMNIPILGFSLVTLFSIGWSIIFRDPFVFVPGSFLIVQIASGVVMVMLPILALMVVNFIEDMKHLRWIVIVFLIAGGLGLVKYFGRIYIPVDTRGLFNLWIVSLSYSMLLYMRNLKMRVRILLAILLVGYIYWSFIISISWLAGWVPGLVAMAVISVMRSKKLSIIFAVLFLALLILNKDYYLGRVLENETAESGNTRLAAWKANWSITSDHLIFGTGPAGYAVYYMTYFPTNAMATHSNYIDIVSQTGILGTFFIIWIFGRFVWDGFKVSMRLKKRGDFAEALANSTFAGTIACIIIMAFGDWLFPFAYTQTIAGFNYALYSWLFMGMILVLDRLTIME